jgi:hypothetical protein
MFSERPPENMIRCPNCQEPVALPPADPEPAADLIHLVCPGCRVKFGVPARLAGTFTRCGQCGIRVMVPRPGEPPTQATATGPAPPAYGPADDEAPRRQASPEERERRSTWAWSGMFLGGLVPAGLLFVIGVVLDWHHQPDRSTLFLAVLLLIGPVGAATGYLLGALAYVLRGEKCWSHDGAQRGSWWGALVLGLTAALSGAVAGGMVGVAVLQQAVAADLLAPGGGGPGRALLLAAGLTLASALVAGMVCAVIGAILGRVLGGLGGYD